MNGSAVPWGTHAVQNASAVVCKSDKRGQKATKTRIKGNQNADQWQPKRGERRRHRTLGFNEAGAAKCSCTCASTCAVSTGSSVSSRQQSAAQKPCRAAPDGEPAPLMSLLSTYSCTNALIDVRKYAVDGCLGRVATTVSSANEKPVAWSTACLLYTSPSPRD